MSEHSPQARKVGLGRFRGEYLYEALRELRCAQCQGPIAAGALFTRMGVEVGGGVTSAGSGLVNVCPSCRAVSPPEGPSAADLPVYAKQVPPQLTAMVRARMGRRANRALGLLGFLRERAGTDGGWVGEDELLDVLASKRGTLLMLMEDLAADGLAEREMTPRTWLSSGTWASLQDGRRWRAADGDRAVALAGLRGLGEHRASQELADLCELAVAAGRRGAAVPALPDADTVARVHEQNSGLCRDRDGFSSRGTALTVGVRLAEWLAAMHQAGRELAGED